MPALTDEQQFVFHTLRSSCTNSKHVKVLNVNSVRSPAQLVCTICNDADDVRELCEEHQVPAPRSCSEQERKLAQHIAQYGVAGAPRALVHELKPFAGTAMPQASVDLLIYAVPTPSANPTVMRGGLLVYWDGSQHAPWDENHRKHTQIANDRRISQHAAHELQYNVVRISHKDSAHKLTIVDAAFRQRKSTGSLWVSPSWNTGAHHIL